MSSTTASAPYTMSAENKRVFAGLMLLSVWLLSTGRPLTGGLAPMLGDAHLRVASVRGFPTSTWPGLLDDLNRLGFAYRWSTRFLCMDKAEAEKELGRLRRQWFSKRKNVAALLPRTDRTVEEERLHRKQNLAAAFRLFSRFGFDEAGMDASEADPPPSGRSQSAT